MGHAGDAGGEFPLQPNDTTDYGGGALVQKGSAAEPGFLSHFLFYFFAQQGLTHNKCHAATEVGAVGATVAQARGGGGAQVMNATGTTELVDSRSCGLMALTTITAGPQGVPVVQNPTQKCPQDWIQAGGCGRMVLSTK